MEQNYDGQTITLNRKVNSLIMLLDECLQLQWEEQHCDNKRNYLQHNNQWV